jgi:dihydrofolate reductase
VLTNHPRESIEMQGGTTFHFVTEGIHSAYEKALESANSKDVRVGGGVSTIKQYLEAKLIDKMHIVISPVLLGKGENLFSGIDMVSLGYKCSDYVTTENATHLIITKEH